MPPSAKTSWIAAYAVTTVAATATVVRRDPTRRAPSRPLSSAYAANAPGSAVCQTTHRYVDVFASAPNSGTNPLPGNVRKDGTKTIALNSVAHASTSNGH